MTEFYSISCERNPAWYIWSCKLVFGLVRFESCQTECPVAFGVKSHTLNSLYWKYLYNDHSCTFISRCMFGAHWQSVDQRYHDSICYLQSPLPYMPRYRHHHYDHSTTRDMAPGHRGLLTYIQRSTRSRADTAQGHVSLSSVIFILTIIVNRASNLIAFCTDIFVWRSRHICESF